MVPSSQWAILIGSSPQEPSPGSEALTSQSPPGATGLCFSIPPHRGLLLVREFASPSFISFEWPTRLQGGELPSVLGFGFGLEKRLNAQMLRHAFSECLNLLGQQNGAGHLAHLPSDFSALLRLHQWEPERARAASKKRYIC